MKFLMKAALFAFAIFCFEIPCEEKVVLITGASRGIGLATAEYLAKSGYRVYAGVRNPQSVSANLDKRIQVEILDVTDSATIKKAVRNIIEKEGRLDVLINNAACALVGPLECLSLEQAQEQMNVNFFGVIRTSQEVLPYMRKQKKGHIINISSEQGVYGLPFGSMYTASKAALESLSEALSIELIPWNIQVSIVEPGLVATNFSLTLGSRELDHNPYEKVCEKLAASVTEKREPSEFCQSPEEIAQFLKDVIEDSEPQLRYQTSESAKESVAECIVDLSGKKYFNRMKAQTEEYYFQDAD